MIILYISQRKFLWELALFLVAVAIGLGSLLYTNRLVRKLKVEEKKKAVLWANAASYWQNSKDVSGDFGLLLIDILHENKTIPVILTDSTQKNVVYSYNLDENLLKDQKYVDRQIKRMRKMNNPIKLEYKGKKKEDDNTQYLFYDQSTLLYSLTYYPYIQLAVILLFIIIAYMAFSSSRIAEQNKVWVGLSKETAHQLGTPISSLMALMEIVKEKPADREMVLELEKDVNRLHTIAERFSKIGSKPALSDYNLSATLHNTMAYLKTRASDKIKFDVQIPEKNMMVLLNTQLFEWVVENVCKNAMDAMEGEGLIKLRAEQLGKYVVVDIIDNGKGIPKSRWLTIFKPGYTTKQRGWGLGLSLTKRIIEEYHKGKIFVADSEIGKGTTIRIVLKNNTKSGKT